MDVYDRCSSVCTNACLCVLCCVHMSVYVSVYVYIYPSVLVCSVFITFQFKIFFMKYSKFS